MVLDLIDADGDVKSFEHAVAELVMLCNATGGGVEAMADTLIAAGQLLHASQPDRIRAMGSDPWNEMWSKPFDYAKA